MTEADRYSILLINASAVLDTSSENKGLFPERFARDFFNDTYLSDQNACNSPHLIYWLGSREATDRAKGIFWESIFQCIKENYSCESVTAVNKLTAAERTAIEIPGSRLVDGRDNRIVRVEIPSLSDRLPDLREACGFFHEYASESYDELAEIINVKYQTVTYFGLDENELREFVISKGLRGIDRVVPMGHSMDFSLIWDGYDLIDTLTRIVG